MAETEHQERRRNWRTADRRRWYDPFVIGMTFLCLVCLGGVVFIATTSLATKRSVDDAVCAQVVGFESNMRREERLATTDSPATRPAHRQSAAAFSRLLDDIRPLVDCDEWRAARRRGGAQRGVLP